MPLYPYECSNGHETEILRTVSTRNDEVVCEECGQPSRLVIGTTHIDPRLGLDPDFPTMSDKWANTRYRAAKEKQ